MGVAFGYGWISTFVLGGVFIMEFFPTPHTYYVCHGWDRCFMRYRYIVYLG